MSDAIKKFIEDRKTPYSEIQDIKVEGGFVTYTEKYDVNHPLCPIVRIELEKDKLMSFSEIKHIHRLSFELMYGSIEEKNTASEVK